MANDKFRIDVVVRLVPYDTSAPIANRSFEVEADAKDHGVRVFTPLSVSVKASEAVRRLITEVYGEVPL